MKCAVVFTDDTKQIMFSPENDSEKMALKLITADDNISIEVKEGSFYDGPNAKISVVGYEVTKCQGGYLRAFSRDDCVMLVLRKKDEAC